MLHRTRNILATTMALLGIGAASLSQAQTSYAIANGGTTLIRFDAKTPGNATKVADFNGANSFLDAIDFRPHTGELYGYSDSADALYKVDLMTGALTFASPSPSGAPTNTFFLGMDFNPTIDRVRVITDSDQNIVFNPNNGATTIATNVFYGAGDVNEGVDPNIIDMAYTNNIANSGLPSQQYAIDYGLDALVKVANNAGTLTTVGSLGIDTDIYTGFDIYSPFAGSNWAYALLTPVGGTAGMYSIDLSTGSASFIGGLGGGFGQVYSLAVAVPEPGSMAMLCGLGLAGVVALRRRVTSRR